MKLKSTISLVLLIVALLATWSAVSTARPDSERKLMINKSTPILHVKSVAASVKFWTERFGFTKTIEVPEGNHVGFAAVENGAVELMFQTYSGMKGGPANPLASAVDQGPSFIFMEVPDIQAVSKALNGADIVEPMHESSYGAKEIIVREPGGHFVIFSQLPQR
jgi:uncharacterized glyoxalase superfamily protein PhnB